MKKQEQLIANQRRGRSESTAAKPLELPVTQVIHQVVTNNQKVRLFVFFLPHRGTR